MTTLATSTRNFFRTLGLTMALVGTLTLFAQTQAETPNAAPKSAAPQPPVSDPPPPIPGPAAPVNPEVPPSPSAETAPVVPPAAEAPQAEKPDQPDREVANEDTEKSGLRRLDQEPAPEPEANKHEEAPEAPRAPEGKPRAPRVHHHRDEVPFGDHTIPAGVQVSEVVSLMGSSRVEGEVHREAVSIFGDTTIIGSVEGGAIAVFGDVRVEGEAGEVVAVLGDVYLGPKARVRGKIVAVGGTVHKSDTAIANGRVSEWGPFGPLPNFAPLRTWFHKCLLLGRPLAFDHQLGWAWIVAAAFLGFYVLLALAFGGTVEKCALTLETHPGGSILATIIAALITPVLIILLAITGIGLIIVPFLLAGLFVAALFGRAVMLAVIGRRFTRYFGNGPLGHAAAAVIIGGLVVVLLYTVPVLGFLLWKLLGLLGFGVVLYTILLGLNREKPAAALPGAVVSAVAPSGASGGSASVGVVGGPAIPSVAPAEAAHVPVPPVLPPPLSPTLLPRAGFWHRTAAMVIDTVLISVIFGPMEAGPLVLPLLAIYAALMWKFKGTTVGGIICGLKVVRLDERPVDWATAIVRALGCFLSMAIVLLGFIWVAFDRERQAWHDKIAGTIVVKVPQGISLV